MANISSFFGMLTLETDKNPWTPEGVLLVYEVFNRFSACGGDYGMCLDEAIFESPSTFLLEFLKDTAHPEDPPFGIGYWGNGRWSAGGTLENFNSWTMARETDSDYESYKKHRHKLLELMEKNEWFFTVSFTDEEGGIGFIEEGVCDIRQTRNTDGTLCFVSRWDVSGSYDYNLYNYSRIVEGATYSDKLIDVVSMIIQTLKEYDFYGGDVPKDIKNPNTPNKITHKDIESTWDEQRSMEKFIVDKELDKKLFPWEYTYECYEAIPEEIVEYWNKRGTA